MKNLLLIVLSTAFIFSGFAQNGKIVGKVISSKTADVLIGATVKIENSKKIAQADQNGQYSLSGLTKGSYKVTCSYVSYTTKTEEVLVTSDNEVVVFDFVMDKASDMTAVVVKSSAGSKPKETINSLLIAQKNSASVSDGISAESIKRTPDRNTGEILKRVSGASLQEDKFAVIRGLNDRYNAAYINGAPLPSSESDRKAFAFDIFPSNMLDNLIIYKTATPDMSGEFAGGLITINTKSIPSENFQSISVGTGFNTNATFQQKKYYLGGQWDFLGIDNSRKLPSNMPGIQAFKALSINERNKWANSFQPKNWGLSNSNASPNTNFQYIIGKNIQRKEKDFMGILFSASYNSTNNRNEGDRKFYAPEYNNALQKDYSEETFASQTLLGLICNISVKINNNNSISLKNLYSINSDNRVITRQGADDIINEPDRYTKSYALWFTSNKIWTSQLNGENYLPKSKIKINWVASYSNIRRDVPALRRMTYDSAAGSSSYTAKLFDINPVDNDNTAGLTFYSTNNEKLSFAKVDFSRMFKFSDKIQNTFKVGLSYQKRDRVFNPRLLAFCNFNASKFDMNILSQTADVIFNQSNIGYLRNGRTGLTLKDITEIRDLYTAGTDLFSYYAMTDQRIGKKFRFIYGARVENFHQTLDAEFNQFTPVRINSRKLDILPSVNFVYSLNAKQNLRLSYAKTLNRPEFRELAPFLFRDYTIKYSVFGDTSLLRASVQNYDLRYEIYPGKSQLVSVSGFYKKFENPIELISVTNQDKTLSYRNTPSAQIVGAEFEIRSSLSSLFSNSSITALKHLTVFGNFTWIQSKVKLNVTDTTNYYYKQGRVMQGQSPYVLNAGITYQHDEKNISSTLSVNRYGQRIFLASNGDALQNGELIEPNLWENGRTQLDFQFTKSFPKKNMEIKLNVKDMLAQNLVFFEDTNNNKKYDKSKDALRSSQNFGRVISFTYTYKF